MDTTTRHRLITEGRTRWFCVAIDVGRRFPTIVHCWARDHEHAREIIAGQIDAGQRPSGTITKVEEQHR